MLCPNCGKELSDTAKFCSVCGTMLDAPEETPGAEAETPATQSAPQPAVQSPQPVQSVPQPAAQAAYVPPQQSVWQQPAQSVQQTVWQQPQQQPMQQTWQQPQPMQQQAWQQPQQPYGMQQQQPYGAQPAYGMPNQQTYMQTPPQQYGTAQPQFPMFQQKKSRTPLIIAVVVLAFLAYWCYFKLDPAKDKYNYEDYGEFSIQELTATAGEDVKWSFSKSPSGFMKVKLKGVGDDGKDKATFVFSVKYTISGKIDEVKLIEVNANGSKITSDSRLDDLLDTLCRAAARAK